jgi:hypothetical protein
MVAAVAVRQPDVQQHGIEGRLRGTDGDVRLAQGLGRDDHEPMPVREVIHQVLALGCVVLHNQEATLRRHKSRPRTQALRGTAHKCARGLIQNLILRYWSETAQLQSTLGTNYSRSESRAAQVSGPGRSCLAHASIAAGDGPVAAWQCLAVMAVSGSSPGNAMTMEHEPCLDVIRLFPGEPNAASNSRCRKHQPTGNLYASPKFYGRRR